MPEATLPYLLCQEDELLRGGRLQEAGPRGMESRQQGLSIGVRSQLLLPQAGKHLLSTVQLSRGCLCGSANVL